MEVLPHAIPDIKVDPIPPSSPPPRRATAPATTMRNEASFDGVASRTQSQRPSLWSWARTRLFTVNAFTSAGQRGRENREDDSAVEVETRATVQAGERRSFLGPSPENIATRESHNKKTRWRDYVARILRQIRVAAAFRDGIIRRVIRTPSPTQSITLPVVDHPSAHAVALWQHAITCTQQQLRIIRAFRDGLIRRVMRADEGRQPRSLWRRAIRAVRFQLRVAAAFHSFLNRHPKQD